MTPEEIMTHYPRLTAHLMCESLGQATPTEAAIVIRDAKVRRKNYSAWVLCGYSADPTVPVRNAFRHRHLHKRYLMRNAEVRAYLEEAAQLV